MSNLQKKLCVYKITSPSKKIYIGSTIDFERRMLNYKKLVCKNQKKLYNSLIKYGFNNHEFEILCYCDLENLRQKEAYYGHLFDCLGKFGLNLSLPKHGEKFISVSEETRRKISDAGKGRKNSEKSRQLLIARNKGNKYSVGRVPSKKERELTSARSIGNKYGEGMLITEKHRKAISVANKGRQPWLGKKHSDEYKKKMSALNTGKVTSEATKERLKMASAKYILLNTQTGIYYYGYSDAAKSIGVHPSTLSDRINRQKPIPFIVT